MYVRITKINERLTSRAVKSDLLEERRINAAESSEHGSALAARKFSRTRAANNGKQRSTADQKCYKCGKWGHISYQCGAPRGDKKSEERKGKDEESRERHEKGGDKPKFKGLTSAFALACSQRKCVSYQDSCASNHMTPDRHRFIDFQPATGEVKIGKGCLTVKGKGTIVIKLTNSCGGWTLSLSNALWVPELDVNLVSVRQLAKKGVQTMFRLNEAIGEHDDGDVLFNALVENDVYYLGTEPDENYVANVSVNDECNGGIEIEVFQAKAFRSTLWHERLGHLHEGAMNRIPGLDLKKEYPRV
ncbi:uncharacterized protein LOC124168727 [Ischnura elegans]|uniref:uncharacterized protein LOC124168727 n=1 Tax=Ischnura elegans TaxID=197161 RepID=UPI001ED8A159|nr:uncharacterized protein LOC124168727 [Ischnura elegans]